MRWPFLKAGRSFFPANAIAVDLGTGGIDALGETL